MDNLRLAVISTPRSGNSWLRHMLAQTFELDQIIVHLPDEIPWDNLPARAIVQLHWPADDAAFAARLAEHGFRVVVSARHPLDVLISILAFCQHDDSTLRWLGGAAQDERRQTDGCEDSQRREHGDDAQHDEKELGAVAEKTDFRFSDALTRGGRFERHAVSGLEERQRRGRRCREPVRQQMEKFQQDLPVCGAES